MSPSTPVDRLYDESISITSALYDIHELSLANAAGDNLRKALVLAAASYFEYRVSSCVLEFIQERASGSNLIVSFVKNKAVSRQYHTWFKWDDTNANQFFGLFGSEFKQMMSNRIKESDELKNSIRSFLEIGNERNKLVHQDFASFHLEKTIDEIYDLYRQSLHFVEGLSGYLRGFKDQAAI
jgi:hypothetical protein